MNVLEQYIKAVHSVAPYVADWTEKYDTEFVEVDVTSDCYGQIKRGKQIFRSVEWEKVKTQGYWMA